MNIDTKRDDSHGVSADFSSTLTLTDSTITTDGYAAYGINFFNNSSGTLNNVTIETTGEYGCGVNAEYSSITLTDSAITSAYGFYLYNCTVTGSNVNIETKGKYSHGMSVEVSSTLTLIGGTITTGGNGINLLNNSSGTVNNMNIETKGANTSSVYAFSSTFTVVGNQLTFHATAVPEPSTWFLLDTGLGLLLLTAHYRRRTRS